LGAARAVCEPRSRWREHFSFLPSPIPTPSEKLSDVDKALPFIGFISKKKNYVCNQISRVDTFFLPQLISITLSDLSVKFRRSMVARPVTSPLYQMEIMILWILALSWTSYVCKRE